MNEEVFPSHCSWLRWYAMIKKNWFCLNCLIYCLNITLVSHKHPKSVIKLVGIMIMSWRSFKIRWDVHEVMHLGVKCIKTIIITRSRVMSSEQDTTIPLWGPNDQSPLSRSCSKWRSPADKTRHLVWKKSFVSWSCKFESYFVTSFKKLSTFRVEMKF